MSRENEKQVAKREAERLARDARRGHTWMDNDPAAQEALDDDYAAGRARYKEFNDDDGHHRRVDAGMGERPGAGRGVQGHRYGGPVTTRGRDLSR